jgi:hypothetical protein
MTTIMPNSSSLFEIESSRKTLVYHLGSEAGFFSEFNNMVLAILYCNQHHINFKLYSKDANFAYDKGWTDFFEPFCPEVTDAFHNIYNTRQPIYVVNRLRDKVRRWSYKKLYHFDYYTFELWRYFHNHDMEQQRFEIDGQDMDLLDATQSVIQRIWRYNEPTKARINEFLTKLTLPQTYVGIHVRRGDKVIEHENEEIGKYMSALQQLTDIKDVFAYTDDYAVVSSLKTLYPDYHFYTLVDESEHGYIHQEFVKKGKDFRTNALLKMFASIDVLSRAKYCVGTFSTNPGMFLGMRMPKGRMVGIDFDNWRIW